MRVTWTGAGPRPTARPWRPEGGCRDRAEPDGSRQGGRRQRHLVVDRRGTPLGVRLSPANRHDSLMPAPTLDAVPGVRHGRGRPKKLHAKAHDHRRCRGACRARSIATRIARRGVETSERLGRHRWIVERTLARLNRFRRLATRYERRAGIHLAFTNLGCALFCLNQIRRFCL